MSSGWTLPGADGETIYGQTDEPSGSARATVVIAHGFKGYMDYGMFPVIARELVAAGCIAHRFNFSHSGMTTDTSTFARPDLFARDTWNRQAFDLRTVCNAVRGGTLAGANTPLVMFGHSRGGVTTLLTCGRDALDGRPAPAAIVTAAAPSSCDRLDEDARRALREQGYLESPSARTGQALRVDRTWLDEQEADPSAHDVIELARATTCPMLVAHGADDPTVPADDAREITDAVGERARLLVIPDCNHVFNTKNPADSPMSPALTALIAATVDIVDTVTPTG